MSSSDEGQGSFLLSLGCAGTWGMADALTSLHHGALTAVAIARAYRQMLDGLERHGISATVATVGLFASGPEKLETHVEHFFLSAVHPAWTAPARDALRAGAVDGCTFSEFVERVGAPGRHEIASHSSCHVLFIGPLVDDSARRLELLLMSQFGSNRDLSRLTRVLPRNWWQMLVDHEIRGYRDGPVPAKGRAARVVNLLREFNVWSTQQRGRPDGVVVSIPSGYVLNWRRGARSAVPPVIAVTRIRRLIARAEETVRAICVWLHPHNLTPGHHQSEVFDRVFAEVATFNRADRSAAYTMRDYCDRQLRRARRVGSDLAAPSTDIELPIVCSARDEPRTRCICRSGARRQTRILARLPPRGDVLPTRWHPGRKLISYVVTDIREREADLVFARSLPAQPNRRDLQRRRFFPSRGDSDRSNFTSRGPS